MSKDSIKILGVKKVCFIGGGHLMLKSIEIFKSLEYNISVIIAPRHENEILSGLNKKFGQFLSEKNIDYQITDDINNRNTWNQNEMAGENSIALCFGPVWIFDEEIIKSFGHGMFNINQIPVPQYLGGAHFTWQLMNDNYEGGCFFQKITNQLDRGPLLDWRKFNISNNALNPSDYFTVNLKEGKKFITELAKKIKMGENFYITPYNQVNDNRLYFPRLKTDIQGFIDWNWSGREVVRFCASFDKPYDGARTYINEKVICLKGVSIIESGNDFHPFCRGLIVRKTKSQLLILSRDKLISVDSIEDINGDSIRSKLREGMRLYTPQNVLEKALVYRPIMDSEGFDN